MKWQPMPAEARLPAGTRVEVLCGQPGQKCGVRNDGGRYLSSSLRRRCQTSIASTRCLRVSCGRSSLRSRDTRISAMPSAGISASSGNTGWSFSSNLPTMRGRVSDGTLNSACLIWFSTISRRSSTMRISVRPLANSRTPCGSKRPRHADLVEAQADRLRHRLVDAEPGQRLARLLVALARGDDAVLRLGRIDHHAVDLVDPREGERGIGLVVLQPMVLGPTVVGPAVVEAVGRDRELFLARNHDVDPLVGEIDGRGALDRVGDGLHRHPAARIARHRDAQQAEAHELVDRGRVQHRNRRRREGVLRLVRDGGGFGAVIVADDAQHAAVGGAAHGVAVFEGVAGAVGARPLAVPDAEHAVIADAGRQAGLLRALERGRRQLLVHRRAEHDAGFFEMALRLAEGEVIAAQGRAAIAGDQARRVQTRGAVARHLHQRQPDEGLDAVQERRAVGVGVDVVERDLARLVRQRLRAGMRRQRQLGLLTYPPPPVRGRKSEPLARSGGGWDRRPC